MSKFVGKLNTEAYNLQVDEMQVAYYNIPAAKVVAADTDGLLDGTALPAAAGVVSTFLNPMPYAMNVTMVCSGTQTGVATVYGTDISDNQISEAFTLVSDTPVVGAKAFKTVTSIALPIKVASETIDVGWGVKFGIPYKLTHTGQVIVKLFNKAADTGTVTANATDLAKNVLALNGTADGAKDIDMYILV
jgi:zona occludens toxin (predicted ATPase)